MKNELPVKLGMIIERGDIHHVPVFAMIKESIQVFNREPRSLEILMFVSKMIPNNTVMLQKMVVLIR